MAKLYRDIIKHLKDAGYVYEGGGKGSHEKWRSSETGKLIIVPPSTKSRHTANEIMKSAGLKKQF